MAEPTVVSCAHVRKSIRAFLDDLLTEEEFQSFCRHLDACPACAGHVASIGALANQVRELGDAVEAPADLASTVIYRVSMVAARSLRRRILIFIVGVVAVVAGLLAARGGGGPKPGSAPGQTAEADQPAAMEPVKPLIAAMPAAPVTPPEEPVIVRPVGESSATGPVPLHWHVTVNNKAAEKKIIKTIEGLGIQALFNRGQVFMFNASYAEIARIRAGITMDYALREFGREVAPEKPECRVSLYFDRQFAPEPASAALVSLERDPGEQGLHWHLLFVSAEKEEAFFELVRSSGGIEEYASPTITVYSLPRGVIRQLAERAAALDGVFAEIDAKRLDKLPATDKVRVSFYLMEK